MKKIIMVILIMSVCILSGCLGSTFIKDLNLDDSSPVALKGFWSNWAYEQYLSGSDYYYWNSELITLINYSDQAIELYNEWDKGSRGDKLDDCNSYCFDKMLETGHHTDCYDRCYDTYRRNKY